MTDKEEKLVILNEYLSKKIEALVNEAGQKFELELSYISYWIIVKCLGGSFEAAHKYGKLEFCTTFWKEEIKRIIEKVKEE